MRKRNWQEYNKALVQRGSITFWIDKDFLKDSNFQESTKGRPKFKSTLIHMGWILKVSYKLTFRGLEGYFNSLLDLMGISQPIPSYSLFCRRGSEVQDLLPKLSFRRPLEVVIDSSGLKIYGEGEWKTHKHGREYKRRWIKIHAAVDPRSGECVAALVTDEKGADATQLPSLIQQCPKTIQKAYADGAYDTLRCRKSLIDHGIEDLIPPRKTAKIRKEVAMTRRNSDLRELKGLGWDIKLWKKLNGYGKRSLVETFFSRLKSLYKERLSSKKMSHQVLESLLYIHGLNKMARSAFTA